MLMALYCLIRGLKGGGWWNFLVSGLILGVGLQGYYTFALVSVIFVLYWCTTRCLKTVEGCCGRPLGFFCLR